MEYLQPYIPIGMILVLSAGFAVVTVILGRLIGPQRPNPSKLLPYESGMTPTGEANVRIPVKFYMVGLLFLLFDVEAVFILAWAVVFNNPNLGFNSEVFAFSQGEFQRFAFLEMFVFMLILMVGYLYVWKKGGFRWS